MRRWLLALSIALLPLPAAAQVCGTLTGCPPASTPLSGAELLYLVQNGVSKKVTLGSIGPIVFGLLPPGTVVANITGQTALASAVPLASFFGSAPNASIPISALNGTIPPGLLPTPTTVTLGGVFASTAPTNQFATGINTSGAVTYAQPSAGQISGLAAIATSGSATDLTTGTVPSARVAGSYTGITGVGTLTAGVWNGTAIGASFLPSFGSAAAGIVPASGGGTANFLRADGNWAAPASISAANPTASVGTTAVNGSASTFMRSDAAPAINLAMAPTWTGKHIFSVAPEFSSLGASAVGGALATDASGNSRVVGCISLEAMSASTSDYTAAWSAIKTLVGSSSACINVGAGTHPFLSNDLTWTMACGQHVSVFGGGTNVSVLEFPSAGFGFNITYTAACGYNNNGTFSFYHVAILTDAANSGGGAGIVISGNSVAGAPMLPTVIDDVLFGNIGGANASTAYWAAGAAFSDVQNAHAVNVSWRGCTGCNLGTPISYSGTSSSTFPTELIISGLDAEFAGTCVSAGGWVQGVLMTGSACTDVNYGLVVNGSGQLQNEFNISNSQIDAVVACASLTNITTSSITGMQCATNRAGTPGSGGAVILIGSSLVAISGSTFFGNATASVAQVGWECIDGTYSECADNMVNNNVFSGYVTNMLTDAGATGNYLTYNRSVNGTAVNLNGATGNTNVGN